MCLNDEFDNKISIIKNNIPMIDLRAPIEFSRGAFPCSTNIPILDNDERHLVGIEYRKEGNKKAVNLGFKLVEHQKEIIIKSWIKFISQNPTTHLYCMRGGKRSEIAQLWLQKEGFNIPRIEGGYKALRTASIEILNSTSNDQKEWIILAGRTGTGKTTILKKLNSSIDLENHASHKGSAFGGTEKDQPTQINFENNIASEYIRHNGNVLFLEDESRRIGKISIPNKWHIKMAKSKIVIIDLDIEERISNIEREYVYDRLDNGMSKENLNKILQSSLFNIRKRLGLKNYKDISEKINSSTISPNKASHKEWIKELLLTYYDPMYDYQLNSKRHRCILKGGELEIVNFLNQIEKDQTI